MILCKNINTTEEVLNKLEMYNMLASAHKQVLLSILDKKNNIEIDEDKFNKYINEYIEAYINYNVYFNAIVSDNIPPHFALNLSDTKIYIMFKINTIYVDTDDDSFINLLLNNGFTESKDKEVSA